MSEPAIVATEAEKQSATQFKWILMLFPFGIFVLGFVSIVIYLNGGFEEEVKRPLYERQATASALSDNLRKIEELGERGFATEEQRQALRGVMTMYESALDIRNTGYESEKLSPLTKSGEIWSWEVASLKSQKRGKERLIIAAAADGKPAAIAGLIALAQSFVAQKSLPVTLEFVLIPTRQDGIFTDAQINEAVESSGAAASSTSWLWLEDLETSMELVCHTQNQKMIAASNGILSVSGKNLKDGIFGKIPQQNMSWISSDSEGEKQVKTIDSELLVGKVKQVENLIQRWVSQR